MLREYVPPTLVVYRQLSTHAQRMLNGQNRSTSEGAIKRNIGERDRSLAGLASTQGLGCLIS